MKRIWFAVLFLLICAGICFAEQYYINDFYKGMSERIEVAAQCENKEEQNAATDEIKAYWNRHNDLIFTLTNHIVLNELSSAVRSINSHDTEDDLILVKAWLNVFYESQKITLSNIF